MRYIILLIMAGLLCAQSPELAATGERAKQAMDAGRFDEAAAIYADLAKAMPNDPWLITNLGLAHFLAGRTREAIAQFEAALKLRPRAPRALLFLGASYLKLQQPAKAVAPLTTLVADEPGHKAARQMLGDALLSLNRYDRAVEQYRRLSEVDPQNPRAWYGLARCYEAISRRAFSSLEKAAPQSGYWFALVASTLEAQQQYPSAFQFYRRALEKQPDLRGVNAALADIYRKAGHADWAAASEKKEHDLGPLDCPARKRECDFAAGRYTQLIDVPKNQASPAALYWQARAGNQLALDAFSHLSKLPPSAEIHELVAGMYASQGRPQEAVKEWQAALKLSPGDSHIESELASSLYQSGEYNAAISLLEALLKRDPGSTELNYMLGDSLLKVRQTEEAIPYLKKAVRQDPAFLPAQASLGSAYLQSGQVEAAVPHLKTALSIDRDGSLHSQLSRAYEAGGQRELAKQMLQKSEQIQKAAQAQTKKLEAQAQITAP